MLNKLEKYWYNEQYLEDLEELYNYYLRLLDYADVYDILGAIIVKRKQLRDENKRILEVINLLEDKPKIVIYLHSVKHMTWEEIARKLNTSNKTVYRHRDKALATLEGVAP